MKPRVLLVDGHSIIFAWPELRRLHARRGLAGREMLIGMLQGLQDASDWHVVVVFDGRGGKATDVSVPSGIRVFYSRDGQTADSVIERIAATYASQYDITVATEDHLERTTVAALGGSSMDADQLRMEIKSAAEDLADTIKRLGRKQPR